MSQSLLPTPASAPVPAPAPSAATEAAAAPPSIAKPALTWPQYGWRALTLISSLRLTVVLFALSLGLIFYGTWAQLENSMWSVVDTYFRSKFVVWIPLKVICMYQVDIPGAIPYPGGWLLGGLLLSNLLAAHFVRFRMSWERSGIFLIHAGIIVMMLGEFVTGTYQVEYHMTIQQGGSTNFVESWRKNELAIVTHPDPKTDDVVAFPQSHLRVGRLLRHEDLPFDLEITRYFANSGLQDKKDPKSPVTAGVGLNYTVVEKPEVAGADPDQKIDLPSAFVKVLDKQSGKTIDTYLVTNWLREEAQTVVFAGKAYELWLRPQRFQRDFTMFLVQGEHENHPGIGMARTYASEVKLVVPATGEERRIRIDMNQPLRYDGETFFQAGMYSPLTDPPVNPPITILQVVRNPGWMMPYLACIMATLGMMIHFGLNLNKFLKKRLQS